jgi:mRNA interferase HigB
MRIVTFAKIKELAEKYPNSEIALRDWYFKTKRGEWENISDVKKTFNSIDYIGNNRYVFKIKGNDFRLVAIIVFKSKKVYIRFIGTHSAYDKIDCSKI